MKEKNVQPLRTAKEIEDMKWALRRYSSVDRWGCKRKDACGNSREKTNKTKRFMLPVKLREEIEDYTAHMGDGEYLFASRKGNLVPHYTHSSL
ncbi:hypothetical protein ACIQD3_24025 [Peribacillus loiseleuriae]|uniref:hypothetical protein n=1 Tax=Peribacillus loiseleuriae TaxID=1679170 RepID=UPI00381C1ED4